MGRNQEFSQGRGANFDPGDPTSGMTTGVHASELKPGQTILANGRGAEVVDVRFHKPGEHSHSPIRDDIPAWEVVTDQGSRWAGGGSEKFNNGFNVYHPEWHDHEMQPMRLRQNKGKAF